MSGRELGTVQLQQRQTQVAAHYAELVAGSGSPGASPDLGKGLALDYSLTLGAAELAWLDATLDRLERQPPSREEIHSDGEASVI